MPKNSNLGQAKTAKNDEFYTQYVDIQKEVNAYIDYNPDVFRGKTILLPCDDPEWSNFTKFFALNFERYGIKKLISTSYAVESKKYATNWQPTLFETENPRFSADKTRVCGKIFVLDEDTNKNGRIDIDDLKWDYLEGDGDFLSNEVRALRDEADIIVTNPPFSLFRKFLAWIMEANKQFLIIGNINAITYKELFPLLKLNKIWMGSSYFNGGAAYFIGDKSYFNPNMISSEKNAYIQNDILYWRVNGVRWFTNLDHGRRHEPMQLMTEADNIRYSRHKEVKGIGYQKFDNYDAINVPKSDSIPSDYEGVMGVPISFMDKYCPTQFEILGLSQLGCHNDVPDIKRYDDYKEVLRETNKITGASGKKTNENAVLLGKGNKKTYYLGPNGEIVHSDYKRIFIRKKQ